PEVTGRVLDQSPHGGRAAAGHQVVHAEIVLRSLDQLVDRVRDVIDGNDVDGRRMARRDHGVGPAGEGLQRRVEDVERGRPTAVALADGDGRAPEQAGERGGAVADTESGVD